MQIGMVLILFDEFQKDDGFSSPKTSPCPVHTKQLEHSWPQPGLLCQQDSQLTAIHLSYRFQLWQATCY
jgi:hypothetical protein